MHGLLACLVLFILMVYTQAFFKEPEDPRLKAIKVNYVLSTNDPLKYTCNIIQDLTGFVNVTKIEVSTDALVDSDDVFDLLAAVQVNPVGLRLHNYLDEDISVVGTIHGNVNGYVDDRESHIDLTWKNLDEGNCLTYKCSVTGINSDGSIETLEREKKVKTVDESSCNKKVTITKIIRGLIPKVEECCRLANAVEAYEQDLETAVSTTDAGLSAISADVQANANRIAQLLITAESNAQKLTVAQAHSTDINALIQGITNLLSDSDRSLQLRDNKLQMFEDELCNLNHRIAITEQFDSIKAKFYVSEPFEGRVYALTKSFEPFVPIESANADCINFGGYLAEVDNAAEITFVSTFSAANGYNYPFIGGTDQETEGSFIWINSRRPLPTGLWVPGQPNNFAFSGEDCLVLSPVGFLDMGCSRNTKYVCEIPLPISSCNVKE